MTITSYFGLKSCCDCGRTGNYTVNKNGYQFTVCSDCVHNYSDEEYENEELEAQIEKMKCCGNCNHFDFNEPNYCHKGVYRERQYVCSKWEFVN